METNHECRPQLWRPQLWRKLEINHECRPHPYVQAMVDISAAVEDGLLVDLGVEKGSRRCAAGTRPACSARHAAPS